MSDLAISQTEWTITLQQKGSLYRWIRSDGECVSPIFSTAQAAHYFAGKIPFLTDDEWEEYYTLRGPESEISQVVRTQVA